MTKSSMDDDSMLASKNGHAAYVGKMPADRGWVAWTVIYMTFGPWQALESIVNQLGKIEQKRSELCHVICSDPVETWRSTLIIGIVCVVESLQGQTKARRHAAVLRCCF